MLSSNRICSKAFSSIYNNKVGSKSIWTFLKYISCHIILDELTMCPKAVQHYYYYHPNKTCKMHKSFKIFFVFVFPNLNWPWLWDYFPGLGIFVINRYHLLWIQEATGYINHNPHETITSCFWDLSQVLVHIFKCWSLLIPQ